MPLRLSLSYVSVRCPQCMENMASAANSPALCSPSSPLKSGKGAPASRATANDALSQVLDVNEKIMADVYTAYVFDECNQDGSPFRGEPKVDPAELKPRREGIMAICSMCETCCTSIGGWAEQGTKSK